MPLTRKRLQRKPRTMRDMLYYERKYRQSGKTLIIGVDEAGRGPLAGPVVAAAVCLAKGPFHNRIDDSKKLTASARNDAFLEICANSTFGIGVMNESVIDRVNILVATQRAMEQAIDRLMSRMSFVRLSLIEVLIDGPVALNIRYPNVCIIKGDQKDRSIAAASILAKVTRDRIMGIYDGLYPSYGFIQHKGYPTLKHRLAIKRFGQSRIHRKSFCCVKNESGSG